MLAPRSPANPDVPLARAALRVCGPLVLSAACAACSVLSGLDDFEVTGAGAGGVGGVGGAGGGSVGCVPPGPWSVAAGDAEDQESLAVAVDVEGNTFITGYFRGVMDLGGGPLTSAGSKDLFVAKFDGCGNPLWSRSFGNNNDQIGRAVAVDGSGNVVVAGEFSGDLVMDSVTLTNSKSRDLLVFKLDSAGALMWAQNIGGNSDCMANGVAVDGDDNILLTGSVNNTVQIDGQDIPGGGGDDVFLLKLDPAGGHVWNRRVGAGASQRGLAVAVGAAGDVVITGDFVGSINFGGANHTSAGYDPSVGGSPDLFVAVYTAAGDYVCDLVAGNGSSQRGTAIAVALDGAAVVTGELGGSATFGSTTLSSDGGNDIFLVKIPLGPSCDPDTTLFTPRKFGGSSDQLAAGLAVGPDGTLWLTGQFKNTVDFGGGPLTSVNDFDLFVAQLDAGGGHKWSYRGGQSNAQSGVGVAAVPGGAALVTGTFVGTIDLQDQSPVSAGNRDLFLARMGP